MIIGLTGAVGAGKSKILKYLHERYSAYIIEADKVGHEVMKKDGKAYDKVVSRFGKDILDNNDEIDRNILGKIVFKDSLAIKDLNAIVHPCVKKEIEERIENALKEDDKSIIVIEAALLIESGYMDIIDELWYVYVDKETRIQRLIENRGYDRKKTEDILSNQLSDDEFRKHCDFVINNVTTLEDAYKQIDEKISLLLD